MAICDFVRGGELVTFTYSGKSRTVQLGTHGHHRSTGNELVRGYQVGGETSGGPLPSWKLFSVVKMGIVAGTGRKGSRLSDDFSPNDPDLQVHCHA